MIASKTEACSPYPTTPILLPEEWLAAYKTMSDITRLQSLGQTGTHPSIIPGCASFASCNTIAPHERTALMRCMVDHGLSEHDSRDSKTEACSPYPTTPILLPEEWLAAYQTMSDITRLQSLGQTSTHPSIIPGCASFASCIDLSCAYAVKVDMNAIESTAQSLLAVG